MDRTHHDYWKTFYEYLTKNYIELTFEPNYCELVKSESPDFKTDFLGLEIVTATSEAQNTLFSLLRKYMNKDLDEIPDGLLNALGFDKKRMYQDESGVPLFFVTSQENGKLFFLRKSNGDMLLAGQIGFIPSDEFNSRMIVNKINEKINKLNSNYILLSSNMLGVYIDYAIISQETAYQKEMASYMKDYIEKELLRNLNNSRTHMFDLIYICFPDVVYKYVVETKSFDFKILTTFEITSAVNKTKNDVNSL